MSVGFLAIAGLILIAGCGKCYIKIDLARSGSPERPVWVGVYFLSQESALDDRDNAELSNPDGIPLGDGVIEKEVYPLYPDGEIRQIERKPFKPEISWVVVAAGFPDAKPCARKKVQVKEGAKLTITVTVDEECINLDTN